MAASINWAFEDWFRAPFKGFGFDTRHVQS